MKKILCPVLSIALMFTLCIGLSATTPQTNEYTMDSIYTITIPQTVTAGSNLTIAATAINAEPGYKIAVTASEGITDGFVTLIRQGADSQPETPLTGKENVLVASVKLGTADVDATTQLAVFSGKSTVNLITDALAVGTPDTTGKMAGTYKGTVNFEISYYNNPEPLGEATAITPNAEGDYVIMSGTDWLWFTQNTAALTGKTVKLGKDLDMTLYGNTVTAAFLDQITFNGLGHTLIVNINATDTTGVFQYVNSGTIKNLTVEGSISTTGMNAGIIGVFNVNSNFGKSLDMENCINKAAIYASHSINNTFVTVGGMVGYCCAPTNCSVQIYNCSNEGPITAINPLCAGCAGGLIGYHDGTSLMTIMIQNCTNSGVITGSSEGGIVGKVRCKLDIDTCTNTGEIYENTTDVTGLYPIYGLYNKISGYSLTVTNCTPGTQNGTH